MSRPVLAISRPDHVQNDRIIRRASELAVRTTQELKRIIDSRSYDATKTDYPLTTVFREDFEKDALTPEA